MIFLQIRHAIRILRGHLNPAIPLFGVQIKQAVQVLKGGKYGNNDTVSKLRPASRNP
jgi:hypothetical protein